MLGMDGFASLGRRFRGGVLGFLALSFAGAAPPPASGQVVINEILARNRAAMLDDDGESSDWVELLNTGPAPVDLEGYALTDDPARLRKWVFPQVSLEPGERVLVWCSGKDRFTARPESITARGSTVPFHPTLIDLTAEWRYIFGFPEETGPPEGWNQPGFDDSTWERGLPGFGFGDGDDTTILPEGIGAAFFRRTFRVDAPERLQSLVLQVRYDDGFVAYLNGVRVVSANFPEDEEPTFQSRARFSREAREPQRFDLSAHLGLLHPGENLLAIALVNLRPTSNDLSLIPELGTVPLFLHTNFRLSGEGDSIYLVDPLGRPIDGLRIPPQSRDHSYGRFPDGSGGFLYMLVPTPLAENDGRVSMDLLSDRPAFDPPGGKYPGPLSVVIQAHIPFPGFEIRYTLNGAPPTPQSALYTGPIDVRRSTVIRAAGFLDGKQVTEAVSMSYFLAAERYDLPIMSVSMAPQDFSFIHQSADGRGRAFERPAYMEIFDAQGERAAATGFGLRLHGGAGRQGSLAIKKAYKAYFRGIYGDTRLRYRVIPDTEVAEFDKLVLRSNFNDAFRTGAGAALIRDQLIRDLHEDMGGIISHGAWYNLFVNMQYRGIYNVVERMDRVFFASYFPEEGENWDVIKTGNDVLDGTATAWNTLRAFMQRNNFADDALYEEATRLVDIVNFTDYMLLNIWAQNHDWPHNNWYAARPRRPDGKWIFLVWDAEFGIGRNPAGYTADTFSHVMSRSDAALTVILRGLLQNPRYQRFFLEELDRLLEGPLAPENVIAHINRLASIIAPDIPEETSLVGQNFRVWENNIAQMRLFAQRRNPVIRTFIERSTFFRFPRVERVTPDELVMEEETEVELEGLFFTPRTTVRFAGIPSPRVELESSRLLRAVVPFDLRVEGTPEILLEEPTKPPFRATGLLRVRFLRPQPEFLQPSSGPESGGNTVHIFGRDFTEGVRVEFGGVPAPSVTRVGGGREILEVVVPPGRGEVNVRVVNTRPGDLPAEVELTYRYLPEASFRRGDADGDGVLTAADAVGILRYLFHPGSGEHSCPDALDTDDSGSVTSTDAVALLLHLFRGEKPPPAPTSTCGPDPTPDRLSCMRVAGCP